MTSGEPREWLRDVTSALGERVRKRREALGLSQEELAHRGGLSRNQVQNLENNRKNSRDAGGQRGHANPTFDTLWSVASVLDLTLSDLFEGFDGR